MSKVKFTKGELKRQRDSLRQYQHYLPTLHLKKQQLQMRVLQSRRVFEEKQTQLRNLQDGIKSWIGLLADPGVDLSPWVLPEKIHEETLNIAGANVPVFQGIEFKAVDYDFYEMPLWVDKAIGELQRFFRLYVESSIIERQIEILQKELRVTSQRVNLFEKVKIPECAENIRRIRIYLGDQQANAVGISKVAKKKIQSTLVLQAN